MRLLRDRHGRVVALQLLTVDMQRWLALVGWNGASRMLRVRGEEEWRLGWMAVGVIGLLSFLCFAQLFHSSLLLRLSLPLRLVVVQPVIERVCQQLVG